MYHIDFPAYMSFEPRSFGWWPVTAWLVCAPFKLTVIRSRITSYYICFGREVRQQPARSVLRSVTNWRKPSGAKRRRCSSSTTTTPILNVRQLRRAVDLQTLDCGVCAVCVLNNEMDQWLTISDSVATFPGVVSLSAGHGGNLHITVCTSSRVCRTVGRASCSNQTTYH